MSARMEADAGHSGRHSANLLAATAVHHDGNGHALHAPVLVLNASYEPINVCAARRALVLVLKGVAMTEEENGHFLHAARIAMRVPSVIRLLEYRRIPHQSRALSRKNILLRDRNTCQYCATVLLLRRVDSRPRDSALARRIVHLGEPGRLLPHVQPAQGKSISAGSGNEADARAAGLQPPHQPPHHATDGPLGR